MTGGELKQLRHDLADALGRRMTTGDMAKLCGLAPKNGAETMQKWEDGVGPSGPAAALLSVLACASERHDIDPTVLDAGELNGEYVEFFEDRYRAMMRAEILRRLS